MGNAALCPSCHADKGVRVQGHLQDVDKALEDGGCQGSGELGMPVSLGRRRMGAGGRGPWRTSAARPLDFLEGVSECPPDPPRQGPGLPGHAMRCHVSAPSELASAVNWLLGTSNDAVPLTWNFLRS